MSIFNFFEFLSAGNRRANKNMVDIFNRVYIYREDWRVGDRVVRYGNISDNSGRATIAGDIDIKLETSFTGNIYVIESSKGGNVRKLRNGDTVTVIQDSEILYATYIAGFFTVST